jgi:hypothetical protein
MNERIREKLIEKHAKELATLEFADSIGCDVRFINCNDIYFNEMPIESMFNVLHGKKYTLISYYVSSFCSMRVDYEICGYNLRFIIPLTQENLYVISGGKCKIVEKTIDPKIEKTIVCGVE